MFCVCFLKIIHKPSMKKDSNNQIRSKKSFHFKKIFSFFLKNEVGTRTNLASYLP